MVFVMEEEYRMQKVHTDVRSPTTATNGTVILEDGSVVDSGIAEHSADDDASIKGLAGASSSRGPGSPLAPPDIPVIKVSTESDRDLELDGINQYNNQNPRRKSIDDTASEVTVNEVEKPQQAAAGEDEEADSSVPGLPQQDFSFSNKRLCERWLDNLFMVLYEVCPDDRDEKSWVAHHLIQTFYARRICESGRSSARRSHISRPNTSYIVKRAQSGKYLAILVVDFIIKRRQRRRTRDVWTTSFPPRLG